MFEYAARLVSVYDGDTCRLDCDLGFGVWYRTTCRLASINAIELHQPGGPQARDHLTQLLTGPLTVRSLGVDKYGGRFDGIITANGQDVAQRMVADGYAAVWDGKGPRPAPPWPIPSVGGTGPRP